MHLFTLQSAKALKGLKNGYLNAILYMTPSKLVCPYQTNGCSVCCIKTTGRLIFNNSKKAMLQRFFLWRDNRKEFYEKAFHEIEVLKRKASKKGLKLAIRPNGTSDIYSLGKVISGQFPEIQVYDYTKNPILFETMDIWEMVPENYHLTFSRSENNWEKCDRILRWKIANVAVVFRKELPKTYCGFPVIDGDTHDLRFLDKGPGKVIGLRAKGKAKEDQTGFVVDIKPANSIIFYPNLRDKTEWRMEKSM